MRMRFWFGFLTALVLCGILWNVNEWYQSYRYANRKIVHLMNPSSHGELTLLVLGGVSHDITYLIPGHYQSLEIPDATNSVELGDQVGVRCRDASWIVYYLGEQAGKNNLDTALIDLERLTPRTYHHLIDSGYIGFVYPGNF